MTPRRRRNPALGMSVAAATTLLRSWGIDIGEAAVRYNIRQGFLLATHDGYRYRITMDGLQRFRAQYYE